MFIPLGEPEKICLCLAAYPIAVIVFTIALVRSPKGKSINTTTIFYLIFSLPFWLGCGRALIAILLIITGFLVG